MNKIARNEVIEALTKRDGYRCFFPGCDRPFTEEDPPTIDHWMPFSIYFDNSLENLRLMHFECNNCKGDIVPKEDGSIDLTKKSKAPKLPRPEVCQACNSGRLLNVDETCSVCGSVAQPIIYPQSKKRKPKNCDHAEFHCWMCVLGFETRKEVVDSLITGDCATD